MYIIECIDCVHTLFIVHSLFIIVYYCLLLFIIVYYCSYSIWFKLPCPQPQVYPVAPTCSETDYQFLASTSQLSYEFTGPPHPLPLSTYQFILQAENSVGRVNSTASDTATTLDDCKQSCIF